MCCTIDKWDILKAVNTNTNIKHFFRHCICFGIRSTDLFWLVKVVSEVVKWIFRYNRNFVRVNVHGSLGWCTDSICLEQIIHTNGLTEEEADLWGRRIRHLWRLSSSQQVRGGAAQILSSSKLSETWRQAYRVDLRHWLCWEITKKKKKKLNLFFSGNFWPLH